MATKDKLVSLEVLKETAMAQIGGLKDDLNNVSETINSTIPNSAKGYWGIENDVASLVESSSGSYFAYAAIPVKAGNTYQVALNGNSGHPPVIIASYDDGDYDVLDTVTVTGSVRVSETITIPTGGTHLLCTSYGTGDKTVTLSYIASTTDKTLTESDVPADGKATGDRMVQVERAKTFAVSELSESRTVSGEDLGTGYINKDGEKKSTNNFSLYKVDITTAVCGEVTANTAKASTGSSTMAMTAFYDVDYDDFTTSSMTAEHCVGVGTVYPPSDAMTITENLIAPVGAKTLVIAKTAGETAPTAVYYESLNLKGNYSGKQPYQSGNINFTVQCPRPIPFGDGTYSAQTNEEVKGVLRLPSTYVPYGKPTRLVLACHGSTGFINPDTGSWYNSTWIEFMTALTNAGYAVFDANVYAKKNSYEHGTYVGYIGFAVGGPLYIQALKRAYDYLQENYNFYPRIFAHGSSMGGAGAKAFTHCYPELVLAQSSFAGRDICKYLHEIADNEYSAEIFTTYQSNEYPDRFALAYGYDDASDLADDKFSHCVGLFDSLGLKKIVNGAVVEPPDRETHYHDWIDYYAEINSQTQSDDLTGWTGKNCGVPYKAWNAWNDDAGDAAQEVIMQNAYAKTGSAPYYAVNYTLTSDQIPEGSSAHTEMCYGSANDMRNQLITWFRRWE